VTWIQIFRGTSGHSSYCKRKRVAGYFIFKKNLYYLKNWSFPIKTFLQGKENLVLKGAYFGSEKIYWWNQWQRSLQLRRCTQLIT